MEIQEDLVLSFDDDEQLESLSVIFDNNEFTFLKTGIKISEQGVLPLQQSQLTKSQQHYQPIRLNAKEIELRETLGNGASSYVQKAIFRPMNLELALKVINPYDKPSRNQMLNDLKVLLTEYKCENLIRCFGAYYQDGQIKIALEYMNAGSLRDILKMSQNVNPNSPYMPEHIICIITKQVMLGLEFLHAKKNTIHRDIKPENILINFQGQVKVTDFGISKQVSNTQRNAGTFVGTRTYMSPERLQGQSYSFPGDVWSLGLIVLEMAIGQYPYQYNFPTYYSYLKNILDSPEPNIPENLPFSNNLRDFINKTVCKDPMGRLSIQNLLKHPWILENKVNQSDLEQWLEVLRVANQTILKQKADQQQLLQNQILTNSFTQQLLQHSQQLEQQMQQYGDIEEEM